MVKVNGFILLSVFLYVNGRTNRYFDCVQINDFICT